MKYQKLPLILLALLVLASCSEGDFTGNGPVVSEVRSLSEFHSVSSEISADIYLTQNPEQSFRIDAHENLLAIIDTRVVNGQLIIETDYNIRTSTRIQVYISAADFRKISIAGSGSLESMNCMSLTDLELRIAGSANIDFCGTVENLFTAIAGSGNVNAFGLESMTVDTRITGSGDVKVTVEESLDVRITGSGSVRYKGNPEVNSTITGSGRVVQSN